MCHRVKVQPAQVPDLKKSDVPSNTDTDPSQDILKKKQGNFAATIPTHIFAENVRPPTVMAKLPEPDERLINTPQLAYCLGLLKDSHELDDILEPSTRNWLQVAGSDEDEHERLKILAVDVIRTFKKEEIKDAKAVAEVVSLAPVLERDIFRDLLRAFYDGIDRSRLLDIHQVQGLAQLIQGADTGYLYADDLVKILGLLSKRLRETHQQSPQHIYQLTLAASSVLDAMADTKVEELDRETLHEPLSSYLDALKGNSEPYLVYQAAYACQALLCVPDNETLWQATIRRTGKVIRGVSGLVSAVKGLNLIEFMDGLKDIQQGIAGASEVLQVFVTVFDGVESMTTSGQGFLDRIKEGLGFNRKCAWYSALRGADTLIRDGEFTAFKRLVCEAPCRLDPAFQWGVCQRLGEVAGNTKWDAHTRRNALSFLVELYRNHMYWNMQTSVKEWILVIAMKLSSSAAGVQQRRLRFKPTATCSYCCYVSNMHRFNFLLATDAETLLHELESKADSQEQAFIQACRERNLGYYPLEASLPALATSSLLDRVQNKPDVEGTLRQLRKQRLKERGNAVYIQPRAKAGLQASDDQRFSLMERVQEFLDSKQNVFLLLGDSGSGKSTFNQHLECELWQNYKKTTGRIPLFINLPAIDKPEQDMIAKQLRKSEFTEPEIRELKVHRKFILICDGYDESQQTHNLYMSNRLNQPGEWNVQMFISCRSEYLGVDYKDRFQPVDRNRRPEPGQFQEAVIASFTPDQVQDYIKQYVSVHQPLWEVREYEQTLDLIPSLKELVRNPFLMSLSLEVLPRMVDPGEHLSSTKVTRVALYDQFIEHWLERGKKRLSEKELSPQAKAAFESLIDEGFVQNGIDFLKKLAVAIYKEQGGQPIVGFSRFKDEGSWKAAFFSREEEKQLLREASPLTRSGNQYRFIHRSLLEYSFALAIFDPRDWKEKPASVSALGRRRSAGSVLSFHIQGFGEEATEHTEQGQDINSPLAWRYLLKDSSLVQFLSERVQQEPIFRQQLSDYIEHSKTDKKWRAAATNAISILIRAGVQFNHVDLRGIQIPGADLSYGVFDSAKLQDADLRQVNLRGVWMRQADLSRAQMGGVQFGELPFLKAADEIWSCAYSPDGRFLALGFYFHDIKIYSTSSWEDVQTLSGHTEQIKSIAYSPKGDRLVSSSYDDTVRLWDVGAGTCTFTLNGHDLGANGVAYSPLGDTVASTGVDSTVRVWDVESGECQLTLIGHTGTVLNVAYSPMEHQIASCGDSDDPTVRLWDIKTGVCLHTLNGHSGSIFGLAYSPQGDLVVSCSSDGTLRIWDILKGSCRRVLMGHSYDVNSVAYSPQGDLIASAGDDNTVRIWDTETGSCRQILTGHRISPECVVFSPKGDYIASGSSDGTVRLEDVRFGSTRQITTDSTGSISGAMFSPRGDQAVSCYYDGSIRLWDVETGFCRVLAGHADWVMSIAYSPRGDLVVSGSEDRTVRLWDVETRACRQIFIGHAGYVTAVAYSPQGGQFASGDTRGAVRVWDVGTSECCHTLTGHTGEVTSIVYSLKRNQIVSSSADSTICIWDVKSGICLHNLSGHGEWVVGIDYSPRGDILASASRDHTLRLWDAETGVCRHTLLGHTETVEIVAYSPQGGQVASGGRDGLVKLWDDGTAECLHTLAGHTDRVTSVVYSPKGDKIVSGGADKAIRLWDVMSGQCQAVITDFSGSVESIAWSRAPETSHFIAGCYDGSTHMCEVIDDGSTSRIRVRWGWRPILGQINVENTLIQDVHGLSQLNLQLLKQRGAVGEPFVRLREASKKVMNMTSVVSTLKQPSTRRVSESSPANDLVDEQSPSEQSEKSIE